MFLLLKYAKNAICPDKALELDIVSPPITNEAPINEVEEESLVGEASEFPSTLIDFVFGDVL
jgi:hypothetical protein